MEPLWDILEHTDRIKKPQGAVVAILQAPLLWNAGVLSVLVIL